MEKANEIRELPRKEGKQVTLKGWVLNQRSSKNIVFVILRDGTGFTQCVIHVNEVGEEAFETADNLNLEDVVQVTGEVVKDERQIGRCEVQVSEFRHLKVTEDYAVANKRHGVGFLVQRHHL
jgi:asparaginyl-tRNA synthetase